MYGVTILLSAKPAVRFIMCLVKRKLNRARGNVSGKQQVDIRKWSSRTSSRVNQHDSSSSIELPSGSAVFSERHSRESQVSNSSGASRNSLFSLKEVVGDGAIVFQYKELSIATECFSPSKKVGNSVYRGCVRGGTEVAIAIHKKGGLYTDFVPKLKTLCSVHHCNVVSMIGACSTEPGDYVYLVYQYVEGSRLRDCIRSVHSPGYSVLDTWTRRLRIAVDVAKGLEYLHEGTSMPMVHKYVKSSNILVDSENLRAKIAQFGIADLTGEVPPVHLLSRTTSSSTIGSSSEVTEVVMEEPPSPGTPRRRLTRSRSRKLTGTKGYMAPEYLKSGAVTAKLDVFAFGVVMLELLSGREPITYRADTTSGKNTIKNYTLFEAIRAIFDNPDPRARLREWVDPVLKDSYPLHLAVKVAQLAKSCVENDPVLRPEMRTVALELSRIMMASEKWEASMDLSKALMSRTMEAR